MRNIRRTPPRPDAGAKQRFVRINVAHAPQQFLVQERALDRRLAAAEKRDKILQLDIQRFEAPGVEARVRHTQPPKTPRIDKPQFPARLQPNDGMGMLGHVLLRLAYLQPPTHPKMNDPKSRLCGISLRGISLCGAGTLARLSQR